jgi:hypothetical protein
MDEEIQDGFAKGEVIRRRAFTPHGGVIEFKPVFGEARAIDFHDTLPGFENVAFGERFDAFIPALLRQQVGAFALEDEKVHDLARQNAVHGGIRAEQQNGRARGTQCPIHRHDQPEVFEKADIVLDLRLVTLMALVEKAAIPFETFGIKTGDNIQRVQCAVLKPLVGGIAHEGGDFILVALLGRAAFADVGLINSSVEMNRLVRTMDFGDVENEYGVAALLKLCLLERDGATELALLTERAHESVLQFISIDDAFDGECSVLGLNAEDDPAAVGVGEGRDGRVGTLGNVEGGFLELDVAPFQLV